MNVDVSNVPPVDVGRVVEHAERIAAAVREEQDAYVDFLRRLVGIESPSTDPGAQAAWQEQLAGALRPLGFHTVHLAGPTSGGSFYARPAARLSGTPVQILLGHGDTVWEHGTLARMPVVRDDDVLRGPGVFDMKAGVTSMVFALRALYRLGLTPPAAPVVLVTSDEEIGSHDSRRHIERLARVARRVFVLEPALGLDGAIKTARKGTGEYRFVAQADADAPANAVILELSGLVRRLYRLNDLDRGLTLNVGTIDAGSNGEGASGRLTVDVRVPTHEDAAAIDAALQALTAETPGVHLTLEGGIERPPLEPTPGNRRLWNAACAVGDALDLDLQEGRAGGASDGNFTSRFTPTLDGLGAVGDGAHATHEFIRVPETLERCALLACLLMVPVRAETEGTGESGDGGNGR